MSLAKQLTVLYYLNVFYTTKLARIKLGKDTYRTLKKHFSGWMDKQNVRRQLT
jgi:hypothetical protein